MSSLPRQDQELQATSERAWRAVVWDDPVNLMSYVTYVFEIATATSA